MDKSEICYPNICHDADLRLYCLVYISQRMNYDQTEPGFQTRDALNNMCQRFIGGLSWKFSLIFAIGKSHQYDWKTSCVHGGYTYNL